MFVKTIINGVEQVYECKMVNFVNDEIESGRFNQMTTEEGKEGKLCKRTILVISSEIANGIEQTIEINKSDSNGQIILMNENGQTIDRKYW